MANGGEIPLLLSSASEGGNSNSSLTETEEDSSVCSAEDRGRFNQTVLGTQNTLALQTEALEMAGAYSEDGTSTGVLLSSCRP